MIMKWSDLSPGDIVEINPKFLEAFVAEFGRKPRFSRSNSNGYMNTDEEFFFTVKETKFDGPSGMIGVYLHGMRRISITSDGALHKLKNGPPLFNLVKLADE